MNDLLVETIEYLGYKINVEIDEYPHNPRNDDNLGKIYYVSNRYTLGDERIDESDFYFKLLEDVLGDTDKAEKWFDKYDINRILNKILTKYVILNVYAYIHSGVSISTSPFSCRWDSGACGWIVAKKSDAHRWYGKRVATKVIVKALENEVELYNKYINGDSYCYNIKNSLDEIIDSCYGFWSTEDAIEYAKDYLNSITENGKLDENENYKLEGII